MTDDSPRPTDAVVRRLVPRPRARPSVQGTLALELMPTEAPPEVAAAHPRVGSDVVLVHPTTRSDVERWSGAFAQALVEVVCGDRPASQLIRWMTSEVHHEVAYRANVVARAGAHLAGQGRARRDPSTRPQVVSVHVSFITNSHVEFCAVVKQGVRRRFVAGCIRRRSQRWTCTELEFG